MAITAQSAPAFDTTTPASFFTNVANLVLLDETANWQAQNSAGFTNTFGATVTSAFGVSNIPVYINGNFVYSSSVQRLLQVTANIYEAMSTNPYPSVYRPTFFRDPVSGNVFINGYQLVASVSGQNDPVLATPVDISAIVLGNVTDLNNINVYGVPWIIGARKGFPSFNELYMLNNVQVTRRMQVVFPAGNGLYYNTTNKQYIVGITNYVGISFWNSYASNYSGSGNLTVYMQDTMSMVLTNGTQPAATLSSPPTSYFFATVTNSWPGSAWPAVGTTQANSGSFISVVFTNVFLPASAYDPNSGGFINFSQKPPFPTDIANYTFPQFGLVTTNWSQAFLLDGLGATQHVIDYVQFSGPNVSQNIASNLSDPNSAGMWSTNTYARNGTATSPTYGEVDQIFYSMGIPGVAVPTSEAWYLGSEPLFDQQLQVQFEAFVTGARSYNFEGQNYPITATAEQAPYTPQRLISYYTLWEANDPLVHYTANDLNYISPGSIGFFRADNGAAFENLPGLNLNEIGPRYQPWGLGAQLKGNIGTDTNVYNFAFRDPLIWGSDYWNFPTGQTWNPNWLGQIHRGTPWQTIYLKSPDIWSETNAFGNFVNIGTNTWEDWTGNTAWSDAYRDIPISDWHLASLLTAILNTNANAIYFSVNNTNANAWTTEFDGLTVVTNLVPGTSMVLSSNSPAVAGLAVAIESTRSGEYGQSFPDVGDVFATPQLSVQSPFLDWSVPNQQENTITDAAYEQLPSQLLSQLGLTSQEALVSVNGQWTAQFTGAAGHGYVLQSSSDLVNWTNVHTNSPINGRVSFVIAPPPAGTAQFYRSQLLP